MLAGSAGPSSGVKNLRAMFETKGTDQSNSPPSRGRSSPNGSTSSVSSRPVSKVRSSFVAVERPGEAGQPAQWGLRKASDVSSMAEVRENATIEEGGETIPSVGGDLPGCTQDTLDLGAILKGSPFETNHFIKSTRIADNLGSKGDPRPGKPGSISTVKENTPPQKSEPKMNGTTPPIASKTNKTEEQGSSEANLQAGQSNKPVKEAPSKIDTSSTARKSKDSPTLLKKSPTLQKKAQISPTTTNGAGPSIKPRGGPSKILGVMQSANKAKEERAKAEQGTKEDQPEEKKAPTSIKPPSVASKATAASRAHAQKQGRPHNEPQPKSPIASRPVKLPSAATATTAASAARKGGNEAEEPKAATRDRKSINVNAPRVANAATKASLAKKSSRASLSNSDERTRSRVSAAHKPADEGFLARMTRPTASSAQRAHDKTQPASPPRTRKAPEATTKKSTRRSLNISSKQQESAEGAAADETELVENTQLGPVEDAAGNTIEDDEGEPGPAEENDAYNEPQQSVVNGTT